MGIRDAGYRGVTSVVQVWMRQAGAGTVERPLPRRMESSERLARRDRGTGTRPDGR